MSRWRNRGLAVLLLGLAVRPAGAVTPEQAHDAERHYRTGLDAMRAESWEEAATEFRAAIGVDPDMVLAHYNLGRCRMAQQRYVEAVAAYRNTKEAFTHTSNLSDQDLAAAERGRQDEIQGLRDNLNLLYTVKDGSAQRRMTEIEERIRLLESMRFKAGTRPPMPAEFPLALGSAYFRQNKFAEAETEYLDAVKLNPKLGAAHNNLAALYLLTGRPVEAKKELGLAEKNGFSVNPRLKEDIKRAETARRP